MSKIIVVTASSADTKKPVENWRVGDDTETINVPQYGIALVDLPVGFYDDWMDYVIDAGVLELSSTPANETQQISVLYSDYDYTMIRNNKQGMFANL